MAYKKFKPGVFQDLCQSKHREIQDKELIELGEVLEPTAEGSNISVNLPFPASEVPHE